VSKGGHNRTHDYTNRYKKLDSLHYSKIIPLMIKRRRSHVEHELEWSDGSNAGIVIYPEKLIVGYTIKQDNKQEEICDTFYFESISHNYGGPDRLYFLCPFCNKRIRFLYLHQLHFKCRTCAKLNYYSQQVTKGTVALAYRMERIIKTHFKIDVNMAPMDLHVFTPPRPKGMHKKTYYKLLLELRDVQEEYYKCFINESKRILGWL